MLDTTKEMQFRRVPMKGRSHAGVGNYSVELAKPLNCILEH